MKCFDNFIEAIAKLKERVGIKRTIREYGIDRKSIPGYPGPDG